MICSLSKTELEVYTGRQVDNLFPDVYSFKGDDISKAIEMALERTEYCFSHINVRGYQEAGQAKFYHLHSDQYATYLWFLANSLWKISENRPLCDKLIQLNKTLHGFWVSYKNHLPDIFLLSHPVGTVLGNADYSDGLVVMQNVTVNTGSDEKTETVKLGRGLLLAAGASIIGDISIGDRCSVGVGCTVYKRNLPDDSVIYRNEEGAVIVKKTNRSSTCAAGAYFDIDF